jgi:transposase
MFDGVFPMIALKKTPFTCIGVGFDTARYGHHVTFLKQDLQLAREPFLFAESQKGYEKLREAFEQLAKKHGEVHFHIRIDAAGQYAVNLECFLRKLPQTKTISIGQPKQNKDYRNVHYPKRKADAVESLACARFAVVERPTSTFEVPEPFYQLREIASALQSQGKRTTRLINQLHNRLSRAFPELAVLASDLSAAWVLRLLQKYPTAQKVAAAHLASLEAIPYLADEKAEAIHKAAKQTTASTRGNVIEVMIRQLVMEIQQSKRSEATLKNLLQEAYSDLPHSNHVLIETIKGIGIETAAALVATMVSIDRFETPDSVVNFFGIFPEEDSSGVDKFGKPIPPGTMRMCKKGNDLVRKLLYMAAQSACQCNPAIRALFARKRAEGKRGDVALGHCMRKLLHLVFAVWKTGKPFDPTHYPWERKSVPQEPAEDPQEQTAASTEAKRENKTIAGRKGKSPKRQAVTAITDNVNQARSVVKNADNEKGPNSSKKPPAQPRVDFDHVRRQITMQEVLRHLNFLNRMRGSGPQRRGPCPVHGTHRERSRSFSVNFKMNAFQCFHPPCSAKGNVLDLWAAVHNLPLREAALHLAETFALEKTSTEKTEPVTGTRKQTTRNRT